MVRPRLPKRPAAWTLAGIAFHSTFYDWELGGREASPGELFVEHYDTLVTEAWQDQPNPRYWVMPPRTKNVQNSIDNYRKRFIEKDVPNYLNRCLSEPWEILRLDQWEDKLALELEFELDLDGILVPGHIDRVVWYPESKTIRVQDLKTGREDEDYRQLGLYALALREIFDLDIDIGNYYYSKLDRYSDDIDLSRFTREYLTQEIKKVDRIIDQGLFLPRPGDACGICEVRPWCSLMGWLEEGEEL